MITINQINWIRENTVELKRDNSYIEWINKKSIFELYDMFFHMNHDINKGRNNTNKDKEVIKYINYLLTNKGEIINK